MKAAEPRADDDRIARHDAAARVVHWLVALLYVLLFASGLALFHPAFYWLSEGFGGGAVMRILHPFLGAALFVLYGAYAARLWRENLLLPSDRVWLRRAFDVMSKRAEITVEGKYNAGQKVLFWALIVVVAALLASGVPVWRPYFSHLFTLDARRIASLAHAGLAFVMFVGIGVHVYASYWTKGSIGAMTRGYVTRAWARFHHPGWLRSVGGETREEERKKAA